MESSYVGGGIIHLIKHPHRSSIDHNVGHVLELSTFASTSPHKVTWYPVAKAMAPTVWQGGVLLPNFGLKTYVVTPDFKSSSGWV
jgi:hypothetical protein